MEKKKQNVQSGAGEHYVWDPDKLTWVEAPGKPKAVKEEAAQESVVEPGGAEFNDEVVAESAAVEAVPSILGLAYGGALIRLGGVILDLLVLFVVMYVITRFAHNLPRATGLGVGLVYFAGLWTWRGQTVGKMITRTKVVKVDGTPVDVVRAVVRYLFYLVPAFAPITYGAGLVSGLLIYLLGIVAIVVIGVSKNKRGIHDLIAGTCVIYSRAVQPEPALLEEEAGESSDGSNPDSDKQDTEKQD